MSAFLSGRSLSRERMRTLTASLSSLRRESIVSDTLVKVKCVDHIYVFIILTAGAIQSQLKHIR